jgi:hypothetical protein
MAAQFTSQEWEKIWTTLNANPESYGLPERIHGSVLLGSFNIRKLGSPRNRNRNTWSFLAHVCKRFDLLSVQEVMDNLGGINKLMDLLGPDFDIVFSDATGSFPGGSGMAERLAFIYNKNSVERTAVATDITYDRTKILEILARDQDAILPEMKKLKTYFDKLDEWKRSEDSGSKPKKPKIKMPVFLSFIRQPFCVSFRIKGHPEKLPYEFMAINAHLYFGNYVSDRRQEFDALMEWILARVKQSNRTYYSNFLLMGDLNLDFNNPEIDRPKIDKYLKTFNNNSGDDISVYFPFLNKHPVQRKFLKTTARMGETYDQIGLFSKDERLPSFADNGIMGTNIQGPDYGVFNFTELFSKSINNLSYSRLSKSQKSAFVKRYEHKVSDHLPLWIRLPLP